MYPSLPSDRRELYEAAVCEFELSDKGPASQLLFRIKLARTGMNATEIDQEIRERRGSK